LIWFLLSLLLPVTPRDDAQFETASVLGYVRDSSGQSVAGSTVKLINTATDVTVVVTTDSQGQYQFTDVHVGQYKIDASASGFNEAVTNPFTVAVNARQRVARR
jgi:protocatechuate 3,4-dioxygenase beta subunit